MCYSNRSEYAVSTWMLENLPLSDALDAIRQNQFFSVEIWADNAHLDPRISPDIEEIRRQLKRNQQTVHSIHAPFRELDYVSSKTKLSPEVVFSLWKKTIDYCEALTCQIMVIHLLCLTKAGDLERDVVFVTQILNELSSYGLQKGVYLALENTPNPYFQEGMMQCTLENQVILFPNPNLRYCLDIGHVPLMGSDMFSEFDAVRDKMVSFHIHNNYLLEDSHYLPNQGLIDWPRLYDYTRKKGYKGQYVLEINGGELPLQTLKDINTLF